MAHRPAEVWLSDLQRAKVRRDACLSSFSVQFMRSKHHNSIFATGGGLIRLQAEGRIAGDADFHRSSLPAYKYNGD